MTMQPTIFQLSAVCKQRLELLKYSANGGLNSYEGKLLKQFKCSLNSNHLVPISLSLLTFELPAASSVKDKLQCCDHITD